MMAEGAHSSDNVHTCFKCAVSVAPSAASYLGGLVAYYPAGNLDIRDAIDLYGKLEHADRIDGVVLYIISVAAVSPNISKAALSLLSPCVLVSKEANNELRSILFHVANVSLCPATNPWPNGIGILATSDE